MNHVLKLNPSNGTLLKCVHYAKHPLRKSYICARCLDRHVFGQNNAKELSTYVAALYRLLKKKQKADNYDVLVKPAEKKILTEKKSANKFTELVKVSKHNSKETRMTIQKIWPSEVSAFAEKPGMTFGYDCKCSYSSTRTYDPSLMMPSPEKIDRGFNIKNHSTNIKSKSRAKERIITQLKTKMNLHKNVVNSLDEKSMKYCQEGHFNKINSVHKSNDRSQQFIDNNLNSKVLGLLPLSAVKILPMPENTAEGTPRTALMNKTKFNFQKGRLIELLRKSRFPSPAAELQDETFTYSNFESKNLSGTLDELCNKQHNFALLLHSYIDVCINNNRLDDALKVFHACRKKRIWKYVTKNDYCIEICNTLLHGYSVNGDWTCMTLLTKWMRMDNVEFNAQTYAALIDCLGRVNVEMFNNKDLWRKEIINVIRNLLASKFTLNNLFTKSLTRDKRERILATIREVLPYFEIEPTTIKLNSNCPLLMNLYKDYNNMESPLGNDTSLDNLRNYVNEQLMIEKNFNVKVKAISKKNTDVSSSVTKRFEDLNKKWRDMLREGFVRQLKVMEAEHSISVGSFNLYIYFKCLPVEQFVDIMMQTVQNLLQYTGCYSPSTGILYQRLGHVIYQRYYSRMKIDRGVFNSTKKLFQEYCSWYLDPSGPARNSRQEWQMIMQDFLEGNKLSTKIVRWPESVKIAIGKVLYDIIFKNVKVNIRKDGRERYLPAFYLILRYKNSKSTEELKCHPSMSSLFRKIGFEYLNFDADQIPMVCPPKPWSDVGQGGYLILPTSFVRRPEVKYGKAINYHKVPSVQLYATFDSLNSLQAVPWIVNEDVLDVALHVFQNGGSEALNVPKLPDTDPVKVNISPGMSWQERQGEWQKRHQILQDRANEYGLWCETLYRLSLANHFRGRTFWLPQNFDFRGRVYPVPPHLNHLGADLFRSLLLFSKGKPLGSKGLDWLKIHTINLTGTHKRKCVMDRLNYANQIMPDILDSAEKPLTGKKWWMSSEEPWQTLAACMELKKALNCPNPELYLSNFPVHQDGSCNGLQHYAALGRDKIGAKSVNLDPSDVPQDVYSVVTQIIERLRAEDEANGVKIAGELKGFISRKVVKQTIMTTVYGVTAYGARLQIKGQLEDLKDFPREFVWAAAGYLTKKTFESLKEMFTSAKEIQDWFIQCAGVITNKNQNVEWVSPIGLPVMQPYMRLLSTQKKEDGTNIVAVPDKIKQKNAFPPNFIHSLDSCHMMLTSLYCEQAGLTFASIHDCFWTHPNTVDVMNEICRKQFVSLHSQSILRDLSESFIKSYVDENNPRDEEIKKIFQSVPPTGNFQLKSVLKSVYFFS